VGEVATRDFLRSELRELAEELGPRPVLVSTAQLNTTGERSSAESAGHPADPRT
jgi:hypothetical protein